MKNFFIPVIIGIFIFFQSCENHSQSKNNDVIPVNALLDQWHRDVAQFDFDAYFKAMSDDAVFIGTDASEVWSKQEFMNFSKPFFDKQQTWDFKPLDRHVYFSETGDLAWFDETLDTWMGVCRGSGVVVKYGNQWLIKHYVLSMTIPNDVSREVVSLKQKQDSVFIQKFIEQ